MRLPRDVSGRELARFLQRRYGYETTRQVGSHMRLTRPGEPAHHITIPDHANLRIGTLSSILGDVAENLGVQRNQLIEELTENR